MLASLVLELDPPNYDIYNFLQFIRHRVCGIPLQPSKQTKPHIVRITKLTFYIQIRRIFPVYHFSAVSLLFPEYENRLTRHPHTGTRTHLQGPDRYNDG